MKKEKLTKESLISLWTRSCKKSISRNNFSFAGSNESPFYVLNLNPDIIMSISTEGVTEEQKKYKINVIFNQFVEYSYFELNESEFKSLLDIFTESQNTATKKEADSIIQENENKFFELISELEVN